MALAEPALRQYGFHKLRNLRFRGGGVLGTAIGIGIGIGYGIAEHYEFGFPSRGKFQPDRTKRTPFVNGSQNGGAYQQRQTLHSSYKSNFKQRRTRKYRSRGSCKCRRCTLCYIRCH